MTSPGSVPNTADGLGQGAGAAATLRLVASTFKLRIGFSIMVCALAGGAAGAAAPADLGRLAVVALAVLVSSASAGALNQYLERDLDARMTRTRARPFASGRLAPHWAWPAAFAGVLGVAVATAASVDTDAAIHVFLGAFTYAGVYTVWLKRRSSINIVIGGLAGSFAVLAGAAAVNAAAAPAPLLLSVALFLWTPPHFWSLALAQADQYAAAEVPMLPVTAGPQRASAAILAHTLVLVPVSLLPCWFGMGLVYGAGAALGGGHFLWTSFRLVRNPSRGRAIANFRASLLQLSLLLGGTVLDAGLLGGG